MNALLESIGDESRMPLYFKKGGRGWYVIPLIALIFFFISVEQELGLTEFVYCCQNSVLCFFNNVSRCCSRFFGIYMIRE